MRIGLYCYFGRFYDHSVNIPGHPLYQVFFLNSIAKKFGIDKFYVHYYPDPYDYSGGQFEVLSDYRKMLYDKLVLKEISFEEALNIDVDFVFLKHRFRNYSRLRDGSLDCYYYERLLERHYDKAYVIDTDGEIVNSEFKPKKILSLYFKPEVYHFDTEVKVIVPVLKDDILNVIDVVKKEYKLTFIGNEYFKVGIVDEFSELKKYCPDLRIVVQGKWKSENIVDQILDRTKRKDGYISLSSSICTIQISKVEYLCFDFLAPRIFEAYLMSTLCFSKNSFMPKFSQYKNVLELSEKIKFLKSLSPQEYNKILKAELDELYLNLEKND